MELRIFLGEFFGLVVFVVIHGGILASMTLTGKIKESIAALAVFLGVSFGLFAALAGGSGAHINPAVTIALLVYGSVGVNLSNALIYIAGQMVGGFVGGFILWVIYRPQFKTSTTPFAPIAGNPNPKDLFQNVITSILGSFFLALLFIIAGKATLPNTSIFPVAAGVAVLAVTLAFSGTSYSMLNIARDLGPRLTATILGLGKPTWIQVLLLAVASIVGAVLAGLVVTFLSHFINLSEF